MSELATIITSYHFFSYSWNTSQKKQTGTTGYNLDKLCILWDKSSISILLELTKQKGKETGKQKKINWLPY